MFYLISEYSEKILASSKEKESLEKMMKQFISSHSGNLLKMKIVYSEKNNLSYGDLV
jgi:hypothetical protein